MLALCLFGAEAQAAVAVAQLFARVAFKRGFEERQCSLMTFLGLDALEPEEESIAPITPLVGHKQERDDFAFACFNEHELPKILVT